MVKQLQFSVVSLTLLNNSIGCIVSAGVGALMPVQILVFGDFVDDIQPILANPTTEALLDAMLPTIKIIVYLGAAMLAGGYITQCIWVLTGENQTRVSLCTLSRHLTPVIYSAFVKLMYMLFFARIWAGLTKLKKDLLPLAWHRTPS